MPRPRADERRSARHQAKVNDVVLDLWSGGLRELMRHRNEPTSGIELITDMPVSLRSASAAGTMGNELGFVALSLPIWESDVQRSKLPPRR